MKKRKTVILSAITCFVSICLLMIGVYAASSPSVSIGGQVSYTARDASVLVQGESNNTGANLVFADIPKTKDFSGLTEKTTGTSYVDWTLGEASGNSSVENEKLKDWNIGTISFAEDSKGIKDIKIGFQFTNYSTYPVQATLTFPTGATASDLESAKVSRTATTTSVYLAPNGGSKQITVTYKLTNDSQSISENNFLGMNIMFEKTGLQKANSVSAINANGGKVTMGKQSESSADEDVEWKCFAYSTDGATWTKLDSGESIPTTAKYGYFVLDTYVSSLDGKEFLASDKYASNGSEYYINAGVNGVTAANTVLANHYYYSDVRKTLKELETTLSISTDSEIYKAIQGRTMADLYKLNSVTWNSKDRKYDTSDQSAPTGADMAQVDTFWLMSFTEAQTYFADISARQWKNGDSGKGYWLRSSVPSASRSVWRVGDPGGIGNDYLIGNYGGVRAAFKLQLA